MKYSAILLGAAVGIVAGAPLVPRTNHEMMQGGEMMQSEGGESSAAGPKVDDGQ